MDPLAGFKQAFEKYRQCQADCDEFEEQERRGDSKRFQGPTGARRDLARRIAAEGLWVSGMAGLFDLLTTNYKAQEQLVAKQLRLARRTTRATIAMAIIAGAAIVATVLGPKFWREPMPAVPQIIYVQSPPMIAASVDAGSLAD
jgi:hypothetical protein